MVRALIHPQDVTPELSVIELEEDKVGITPGRSPAPGMLEVYRTRRVAGAVYVEMIDFVFTEAEARAAAKKAGPGRYDVVRSDGTQVSGVSVG